MSRSEPRLDLEYWLTDARARVTATRDALDRNGASEPARVEPPQAVLQPPDFSSNPVFVALAKLSQALANSYAQVCIDLESADRLSWAGTAHEIRQMTSTLLELLAPDEEVMAATWFKQDPNTSGPTQAQRARFAVEVRQRDSTVREVVEHVAIIDERLPKIVRSTYRRASDAAHRFKSRNEARGLLRYFDAFVHDLLDT